MTKYIDPWIICYDGVCAEKEGRRAKRKDGRMEVDGNIIHDTRTTAARKKKRRKKRK